MDRSQKEQVVEQVRASLSESSLIVVTTQVGLTVEEVTELRRVMREAGAEYKVMKNTLARIAVKGTPMESMTSMFSGPMAIAYSKDPIAAAKVTAKYSNSNEKIKIVGGFMNGQMLNTAAIKALATLPSMDELRAKLIGVISAPATKLATLLQEPAARVARVIAAKKA
jgi:large subunit ribosomal protein L10